MTEPAAKESADTAPPRLAKKKIAVVFGYVGNQFSGLQLNDGVRTVEQVLEQAFHRCGCIADYNHDAGLQKVQWTRSSRTDKGVHAAVNVVSLKCMRCDDANLIEELRSQLPDDVHLYGCLRVTKSFHSKLMTTSRQYEYILPRFVLGRAVSDAPSNGADADDEMIRAFESRQMQDGDLERFNSILSGFLGTNRFHNFTTGTSSFHASANRFITRFEADVVGRPDGDLIRIRVHGQAFLYNQIRKMIGTCVAIYHHVLEETDLKQRCLFDPTRLYKLPLAPASGLFLQRPLFRDYGLKLADRNDLKPLDFADFESDITKFVDSKIYTAIVSHDRTHHVFANWMLGSILNSNADWNCFREAQRPSEEASRPQKKKRLYRTEWN